MKQIKYWELKQEAEKFISLQAKMRLHYSHEQEFFSDVYDVLIELGLAPEVPEENGKKKYPLHLMTSLKGGSIVESRDNFYAVLNYLFGDQFGDGLYDPTRIPPRYAKLPSGGTTEIPRAWSAMDYKNFISSESNIRILVRAKAKFNEFLGVRSADQGAVRELTARTRKEAQPTSSELVESLLNQNPDVGNFALELLFQSVGMKLNKPLIDQLRQVMDLLLKQHSEVVITTLQKDLARLDATANERHQKIVQLIGELSPVGKLDAVTDFNRAADRLFKEIFSDPSAWSTFLTTNSDLLIKLLEAVYGAEGEMREIRDALNQEISILNKSGKQKKSSK